MKRNFGFGRRLEIDPKVRSYFPWSLFLVCAIIFMLLAMAERAPADEAAPVIVKPTWTCETVRAYLVTHTEAEARAKAVELHLPQWLVRKAEKCVP